MRPLTILCVLFLLSTAGSRLFASGGTWDKHMIITFSGPVQVPGMTIPAGTYVFRTANPDSPSVVRIFDASERHVIGQFFYTPTRDRTWQEQNAANGRPVVTFRETPAGVPPALDVIYYPTDLSGRQFRYSKAELAQLNKPTAQPVATSGDTAAVPDATDTN